MIFEFPLSGSDFSSQLQFARSRIQALWIERLSSAPHSVADRDLPVLRALVSRACDMTLLELQQPSRPVKRVAAPAVESLLDTFFEVGRGAFREVALALVDDVKDARTLAETVSGISEAFERMRERETATYRELLQTAPGDERRALVSIVAPDCARTAAVIPFSVAT